MVDRQLEPGFGRDGISGEVTPERARRARVPLSPVAQADASPAAGAGQPPVVGRDDAADVIARVLARASGRPSRALGSRL